MKKKIYARLLLIAAVVLVLALALSMVVYQTAFSRQAERDVAQLASVIAAGYEAVGSDLALRDCAAGGLRITHIDADGTVRF